MRKNNNKSSKKRIAQQGVFALTLLCVLLFTGGCRRKDETFLLEESAELRLDAALAELSEAESAASGILPQTAEENPAQNASGTAAAGEVIIPAAQPADAGSPADGAPSEASAPIYVHVCGAVEAPAVYELPADARVTDAVNAAGGFSADADEEFVNLAASLSDGMRVRIPTRRETETGLTAPDAVLAGGAENRLTADIAGVDARTGRISGETGGTGAPVNINTADEATLRTLSGIGAAKAADIIRYREQHGAFSRIEDIMNVPGIKEGLFEKIREQITV